MNDLISRKAAIELVKDVCDVIMRGCNSHYDPGVGDEVYDDVLEVDAILKCNKEIRKSLKDLPSAQPEIIRCKDCKWLDKYNEKHGYCMAAKHGFMSSHWEISIYRTYDEDFFCADAEPKEKEGGANE